MKINKILSIFPLITLLLISTSCSETPNEKFSEYYDNSWVLGESALQTNQPTLKNPIGKFGTLNELRRSQNKVGLPSGGDANILVVPINFKDDVEIQEAIGYENDITFTDDDIKGIEETYFNEKNSFGYPSVSSFYKTSSFGKLNLSGVVSPVVTLPDTYTSYLMKSGTSTLLDAYNLIIDYVYNYLFVETKTYYIGDFDSDNDKRVDAISLVCNYSYSLTFSNTSIDTLHKEFVGPNNVYFSDTIKDINKTPVNSYSLIADSFRTPLYLNHDSRLYISLIGQMIGLDCYEDRILNPQSGTMRAPLGYLDVMSGATGDHNSFSKFQLGWIEPKFIKADDISDDGLQVTINSAVTSGESIILYNNNKSMFGEYLIIDLYNPKKGVNAFDSVNASAYGKKLFSRNAVRVYQVDSRLVRGYGNSYASYNEEPKFDELVALPNGEQVSYTYNYAYTNNSVNNYASFGFKNYPLVSLLSKNGSNRHLTYYGTELKVNDMFLEGDIFGANNQINGFYKDFSFHGNGNNNSKLNITFEITSIQDEQATITFRRVK